MDARSPSEEAAPRTSLGGGKEGVGPPGVPCFPRGGRGSLTHQDGTESVRCAARCPWERKTVT